MCVILQLLAEGLCAKHDLELADFTPHTETQLEEGEEDREGETDTGDKISQT